MKRECLSCGDKNAPFGFGGKHNPYWLCFSCWIATPDGQRQMLLKNKQLTQDEKDTDGFQ